MTTPTPTVAFARTGSAAEILVPPPPTLTLVRDDPQPASSLRIPLILSALVIGASFFSAPALTDNLTGKASAGAVLELSPAYKILAPICDALDTISLFSQGQHVAFFITCAVAYLIWRVLRTNPDRSMRTAARDEINIACVAVLVLLAIYLVGSMLPRPRARLAMTSPDEVVIDFHSHTRYSWDGRSSFSPDESRRWHHASGFDVAYITDHSTFAGAEQAAVDNPAHAGDATVMLSGIEVRGRGSHLVVLGTDAADWQAYTAGDLHEPTFRQIVAARRAAPPVVLFTIPGNLKSETAMPIDGIELSDAAPRGLSESDARRGDIIKFATDQRKALVASSNNHGWASATPAWSVMNIHDWRAMTPAQLDVAIRRKLLSEGPNAVRVIDRRAVGPSSLVGFSLTVPAAAWRMLSTMTWPERISWLCWVWIAYGIAVALVPIRVQKPARLSRKKSYRIFPRWRSAAPIA